MIARTFSSLRVPNYRRYFTGQAFSITGNWMQIVGEMWLMVKLTGSGVSVGPDRRAPVPPDPALRRLGRPARRPDVEADAADDHAARADRAGADAVRPVADRRGRAVDGARAGADPRHRAGAGQPGAAVVRGRDRGRRPGAERGRAELGRRALLAHPRPRPGRHRDRADRHLLVLRAQRPVVRGDVRRPAADGPARAADAEAAGAQARRPRVRAALRARHARSPDPAGDDGVGRDDLVQLPGAAAAARGLHLARHGGDLRGADGGDGRRLRRGRARRGRARAGLAEAAGVVVGWRSGPRCCWPPPRRRWSFRSPP